MDFITNNQAYITVFFFGALFGALWQKWFNWIK